MNTIERLKQLEARIYAADAHSAPKCLHQFLDELGEAWPKLLAVVEAHKAFVAYCEDRFTWSAKPDEWEYITDDIELAQAKKAIAALGGG